MTRYYDKQRRPSTQIRDNRVHEIYQQILSELGKYSNVVAKSYIYQLIHDRTGLCVKTIAYIINHTRYTIIK